MGGWDIYTVWIHSGAYPGKLEKAEYLNCQSCRHQKSGSGCKFPDCPDVLAEYTEQQIREAFKAIPAPPVLVYRFFKELKK